MKQGSKLELNPLEIIYSESRLFRPNTKFMNPLKSIQKKRLPAAGQRSRSCVDSSDSLLKPREKKFLPSQASHTSIDCSEHSEMTNVRDSCKISIVITPQNDSSHSQDQSKKEKEESPHSTVTKKSEPVSQQTANQQLNLASLQVKDEFRLSTGKKTAKTSPQRTPSSPLNAVHKKISEEPTKKPPEFRLIASLKIRARSGLGNGRPKHSSMNRGNSAQEKTCSPPKGFAFKLDPQARQPIRLQGKKNLLEQISSKEEELRPSKPIFFIVKKKIQ
jgi:hypothetical protein